MPATKFLHSRYALFLAAALMLLAGWAAYESGCAMMLPADRGTALPSANMWISDAASSCVLALTVNLCIAGVLWYICRGYNLLRSMSTLFGVLFAFMEASTPELTTRFTTGLLLALAVCVCVALMFGCYGSPWKRRQVFLVFFLLSAGAATQYAFAVYVPVMILVALQMRVLTMRAIVAALLGILSPWWLLFGLGIVSPADVHLPEPTNIFSLVDLDEGLQLGVAAGFGACLFVMAVVLDFFRTMAYNARSRSFNGTIVLLGLATILAMMLDYRNMLSYMPLLNACSALQCAQFFIIHRKERSWIAIAGVLSVYVGLFIWNILS